VVQANLEQQGGYLDDGINQDLFIGSDWYDPEDLDGSSKVQGEAAGEDGAADVPRLRSRTPEASNTRGKDARLGELHSNLILTIMTKWPQMVNSSLTDARNFSFQILNGYDSHRGQNLRHLVSSALDACEANGLRHLDRFKCRRPHVSSLLVTHDYVLLKITNKRLIFMTRYLVQDKNTISIYYFMYPKQAK